MLGRPLFSPRVTRTSQVDDRARRVIGPLRCQRPAVPGPRQIQGRSEPRRPGSPSRISASVLPARPVQPLLVPPVLAPDRAAPPEIAGARSCGGEADAGVRSRTEPQATKAEAARAKPPRSRRSPTIPGRTSGGRCGSGPRPARSVRASTAVAREPEPPAATSTRTPNTVFRAQRPPEQLSPSPVLLEFAHRKVDEPARSGALACNPVESRRFGLSGRLRWRGSVFNVTQGKR